MHTASKAALAVLREAAEALLAPTGQPTTLKSIFSVISAAPDVAQSPAYLSARSFRIDHTTLFPVPDEAAARACADGDLRSRFEAAYTVLDEDSETSLEQLYYLVQEYAWAVPSAQDEVVSLFDQARTDAAIAAAQAESDAHAAVVLVGGDISGVQAFIYTLTAAGATKALRARSFYLQLLTDAIARYLLQRAGMPLTNLLYSGGGRFYLVLPAAHEANLDRWRQDLSQFLLRRHGGELYVALGAQRFDPPTLSSPQAFVARWQKLGEAVNDDKRRRFAVLEPEVLAQEIFAPQGQGGGIEAACVVCRYQGAGHEFEDYTPDVEDEVSADARRRICKLCASFRAMAQDLHNARFLVLTPTPPVLPTVRERVPALSVLQDLGVRVRVAQDERELERIVPSSQTTTVLSLTDPVENELRRRLQARPVVWGTRPLVNVTPTIRQHDLVELDTWLGEHPEESRNAGVGAIKTFGMLVEQSIGVKRLGVLRMDVDDLGDLFAYRLRDASLARIGGMSAALVRFFEGWIGALCRELNEQEGQRVYAVYSGGDDLFIVGSWDVLPELARRVREDLRAYALNEHVRLSAGLSLHPAKFPLYQAAQAAGDELERAKARPDKDAWGFLEQVVGWGAPAAEVFALCAQFARFIDEQRLSRAVLQVVQALYSEYLQGHRQHQRAKRAGTFFFGPWIWHGVYQLARMADERRTKDEEVASFLDQLRIRLTDGTELRSEQGGRFIERLGLAARWAQLVLRKE